MHFEFNSSPFKHFSTITVDCNDSVGIFSADVDSMFVGDDVGLLVGVTEVVGSILDVVGASTIVVGTFLIIVVGGSIMVVGAFLIVVGGSITVVGGLIIVVGIIIS